MPSASKTFRHHHARISSLKLFPSFSSRLSLMHHHAKTPGSNQKNSTAKVHVKGNQAEGPYAEMQSSSSNSSSMQPRHQQPQQQAPILLSSITLNNTYELGQSKTVTTSIACGPLQSSRNDGIRLEYEVQQSWERSDKK